MEELRESLLPFLTWLQSLGGVSALLLVTLQVLLVVAVIPGPYFTLASGFLFGVLGGGALMVLGATLGSAIAYGLGRKFSGARFQARLEKFSWVPLMRRFLAAGGVKVVLSTRLIPFFPFKLSNYFFGAIRFPFRPFIIGTAIGIIPVTWVSVSAGSLASNLASLLDPRASISPFQWMSSVFGLLVALILLLLTTRNVKAELRRSEEEVKVR
jgi:uncharacterized membrane protein YdjX (TVP38/TMEM64 family)